GGGGGGGGEGRGDRRVCAADQRDVELAGADLSRGRGHRVRAGGTLGAERDNRPRNAEVAGGHGRGRVRRGDEREGTRHAAGTVLAEERAVILLDLRGAGRRAQEESRTRRSERVAAEARIVDRQAGGGDGELAAAAGGPGR